MHLYGDSLDSLVKRLQPAYNSNPADRAHAWNEWIMSGGCEPVRKFIRWSNGTTTDDDEILQETLIVAFVKVERGQYEDRNLPFSAFLKKIAWYKIMEASRRGIRHVSLEDVSEFAGDDHDAHHRADSWKEYEALQGALASLPARRKKIMLLYENGYSTSEIAFQLEIREELVRKEKSLGMRQLRETVVNSLQRAG